MIYLANVAAYDGTRTYRTNKRGRSVMCAFAGTAQAVLNLKKEFPDWQLYGSPHAELFLLARPGLAVSNVGAADEQVLLPSTERWLSLTAAEVEEFLE